MSKPTSGKSAVPGKATSEQLDQLHGALVKALLDKIVDADGNVRAAIDPRDLATAARVLKDNDRSTPPDAGDEARAALDKAAASLPYTDEPFETE